MLFISPGVFAPLEWNLHNTNPANSIIKGKDLTDVGAWLIPIFRGPKQVEVTENQPFCFISHFNMFEPVKEG
jgi:hypothetical protein